MPDVVYLKEAVFGVDLGYHNPTVCLIVAYDNDGRAYVIEEYYERGTTIEVLIEWMKEKKAKYGELLDRAYVDPSQPQMIQMIINAGLNATGADNAVLPGINKVFDMLQVKKDGKPMLYILESCKNTIEEFQMYRYKESKEDAPQQENPLKVNDHAMDALRYAIKTHNFGSPGYWIPDDAGDII